MKTKKIDVAVIGLGEMGMTHSKAAISSEYVNKAYGYDPVPSRQAKASALGVAVTDIESIMDNPNIKLVYIASINKVHVEQAILALRAGKAVMCEKPMGDTLEQATELIKVQKETNGFFTDWFRVTLFKIISKSKTVD